MAHSIELSRRETELVVEELRELVVPSRLQRVFEATARRLVFQLRAPGTTYHLLLSTEDDDVRLHLVDAKPDQPDHPSPFTMQLRKWLHGAWLESIQVDDADRIVSFHFDAIDPEWEPESEDDTADRRPLTFVAELLGRHPNMVVLDAQRRIIGTGDGALLGDRNDTPGTPYESPPPPPDWADTENVRPLLEDPSPDGARSEALATHFKRSLRERNRRELKQSIRKRLDDRYDRIDRRIGHIEQDLQRIDDADEYRRRGELLQSAYGDVDPGASSVTVPDFYRDGMPSVEIPLDPAKDLQENIEDYFHEYRRLTAAREKVETRLLNNIELRDDIEEARRQLEDLQQVDELEQFTDRLEDQGILEAPRKTRRDKHADQKPLPPYREFEATSGSKILVGRNAQANDEVTTSVARGRDIWLHARNFPGSHVILRMRKDDELRSNDLVDAATLAAHFSGGQNDTVVEVTYTEAKHVRKPKGAAPGTVTIGGGGSTIAVRIEQPRLDRLFDSEISHR